MFKLWEWTNIFNKAFNNSGGELFSQRKRLSEVAVEEFRQLGTEAPVENTLLMIRTKSNIVIRLPELLRNRSK